MSGADERCGTPAGYQAHRKERREDACDDCKRAQAEYTAALRRANPELYAQSQSIQRARDRALRRLARQHPAEFDELYREELLKKAGEAA